jgi:hypothetical protein
VPLFEFVERSKRNTLEVFADKTPLPHGDGAVDYLKSVKDVDKIALTHRDFKFSLKATEDEIARMRRADIISNRFIGDRFFFIEGGEFAVSDTFFVLELKPGLNRKFFSALLNSTVGLLGTEIAGRKNMGDGVLLVYGPELRELVIPNPNLFGSADRNRLIEAYKRLACRPVLQLAHELGVSLDNVESFEIENVPEDRQKLDSIIFDVLGLDVEERENLYRSFLGMVAQRLSKSQSV